MEVDIFDRKNEIRIRDRPHAFGDGIPTSAVSLVGKQDGPQLRPSWQHQERPPPRPRLWADIPFVNLCLLLKPNSRHGFKATCEFARADLPRTRDNNRE